MRFVMSECVDTLEHWLPTTISLVRLGIAVGRRIRGNTGTSREQSGYERDGTSLLGMSRFEVMSIGTVRNERTDIQNTDNWGAVRSTITIDERFGEASLQGLEGFSHVEVLFLFAQFPEDGDHREPRPYRGRSDLPPVGVFAGRGPRRPNRIGVTCCAIESVQGRELTVTGLDAVSGTPVIDVKAVADDPWFTQTWAHLASRR
ncbi:SAM-dependent methyltransferase [Paractinoplanes rishiriensis]|uniref:TsaA-like domain-containing protein n=1 Tax=Paractinoplanes rishiriensis TaxID=1050105 RepID=A0A919N0U3_9ACTN|nr:SAM-dependent methyltransferase [Actinoplanes rishiriensis]GIF00071.1 hypothetical protein Ari01nite_75350 [Actinoplanes rishiriensis]